MTASAIAMLWFQAAGAEEPGSSAFVWFHLVSAWFIIGLFVFLLGFFLGMRAWPQPPQTISQVKELRIEEAKLKAELRKRGNQP